MSTEIPGLKPVATNSFRYRGYTIVPCWNFPGMWQFAHDDLDLDDTRHGVVNSLSEAVQEIDWQLEEAGDYLDDFADRASLHDWYATALIIALLLGYAGLLAFLLRGTLSTWFYGG